MKLTKASKAQSNNSSIVPNKLQDNYRDCEVARYNLRLSNTFGSGSVRIRDMLRVDSEERLIYPCGNVMVISEIRGESQQHFTAHKAKISCFDINKNICASGELSKESTIYIWDIHTLKTQNIIAGFFSKGVEKIRFSQDGRFIAVAAKVENGVGYFIVVFEISRLINTRYSGKKEDKYEIIDRIDSTYIMNLAFDPDSVKLCVSAREKSFIYKLSGKKKSTKQELKTNGQSLELITCVCFYTRKVFYTGSMQGSLIRWQTDIAESVNNEHSGAILAMTKFKDNFLITGGDDGKLYYWNMQQPGLTKIVDINLEFHLLSKLNHNSMKCSISSLCSIKNNLTVACKSGVVLSIENFNTTPKISLALDGACDKLIPSIAVSLISNDYRFITACRGGYVYAINYKSNEITKQIIKYTPSLLDVSSDNIAVACLNGSLLILSLKTLEKISEVRLHSAIPTFIKFSVSSELLAIGYEDGYVVVLSPDMKYSTSCEYTHQNMSPVTNINFSVNHAFLKIYFKNGESICITKETLGIVVSEEKEEEEDSKLRRVPFGTKWENFSDNDGWQFKGLRQYYNKYGDIKKLWINSSKDKIIVLDRNGVLNIAGFPCYVDQSTFIPIALAGDDNCDFTPCFEPNRNNIFLVSAHDGAIFHLLLEDYSEVDHNRRDEYLKALYSMNRIKKLEFSNQVIDEESDSFEFEDLSNSLACLWPTNTKINFETAELGPPAFLYSRFTPTISLHKGVQRIRCVYKEMPFASYLYTTGSMGVLLNANTYKQKFLIFHRSEISACTISSRNHSIGATGDSITGLPIGETCRIVIWNLLKLLPLAYFSLQKSESVKEIRFSEDQLGEFLVSLSHGDQGFRISVYDWRNWRLVNTLLIGSFEIRDIQIKGDPELEFVTAGINHMQYWRLVQDKIIGVPGKWGKFNIKSISAVGFGFAKKKCFTGTDDGKIITWDKMEAEHLHDAHKSYITILQGYKERLYSGCKRGHVIVWHYSENLILVQLLFDTISKLDQNIPIVAIEENLEKRVQIVTENGDIIQISKGIIKQGIPFDFLASKITSYALDKSLNNLLISSADGRISLWSLEENKRVRFHSFNNSIKITALQIFGPNQSTEKHPNNRLRFDLLVLADTNGRLHLWNMEWVELDLIMTNFKKSEESISLISASPDNSILAITTDSKSPFLKLLKIDIVETKSGYEHRFVTESRDRTMVGLNFVGRAIAMDWTSDGKHMIVNSDLQEITVILIDEIRIDSIFSVNDKELYTQTTIFNHFSRGLHCQSREISHISACFGFIDEALKFSVTVVGTYQGCVFTAANPCILPKDYPEKIYAHSSPITKIGMICNEELSVAVTSSTDSLFVWDIEPSYYMYDHRVSVADEILEDGLKTNIQSEETLRWAPWDDPLIYIIQRNSLDFGILSSYQHWNDKNMLSKEEITRYRCSISTCSSKIHISPPDIAPSCILQYGLDTSESSSNLVVLSETSFISFNKLNPFSVSMSAQTVKKSAYKGHRGLVSSIAKHPYLNIVATGDSNGEIHIWESTAIKSLYTLKGDSGDTCHNISFSLDGNYIAALFFGTQNLLLVFDIHQEYEIFRKDFGSQKIRQALFRKDNEFVTAGNNHFYIWRLEDRELAANVADFGNHSTDIISLCLHKLDVFAGTAQGDIQIWRDYGCSISKQLNNGPILTISINNKYIYCGAANGTVILLRLSCDHIRTLKISDISNKVIDPIPRAIGSISNSNDFLIVCRSGELLHVDVDE